VSATISLTCLGCGHPVGDPVRPGKPLHERIPISRKDLLICCKCFEWMMGQDDGTLRLVTSRERAYLLIHRGGEMIRMLAVAAAASNADRTGAN
jgi:hypothetical protein